MPLRRCNNCLKIYDRKSNYDVHINNRTVPCPTHKIVLFINEKSENPINIIEKIPFEYNVNSENAITNLPQPIKNLLNINDDEYDDELFINIKIKCVYCTKNFSRSDALNRHNKFGCKMKEEHIKKSKNEETTIEKIKNDMEEKFKQLQEKIVSLEKENNDIKKKTGNKIIKTKNVNSNNVNSNNNLTQNNIQNNHIVMISHGKEDMSKIDPKIIIDSLKLGYDSVPNLIEKIHYNSDYPEFQNIYLSCPKNPYMLIYDEEKWNYKEVRESVDSLYDTKVELLEEYFDELQNKLSKSAQDSFKRFIKDNDNNNKPDNKNTKSTEKINKIKNKIKLMTANNKEMVIKTRKNTVNAK